MYAQPRQGTRRERLLNRLRPLLAVAAISALLLLLWILLRLITGVDARTLAGWVVPASPWAGAALLLLWLLAVVGAVAWNIARQRRELWSFIEHRSVAAASHLPQDSQQQQATSGPLLLGGQLIPRVQIAVLPQGLLLWQRPGSARVIAWDGIRQLITLADRQGTVRAVTVVLEQAPWGPDRFTAPWSLALSARALEQGRTRLADDQAGSDRSSG